MKIGRIVGSEPRPDRESEHLNGIRRSSNLEPSWDHHLARSSPRCTHQDQVRNVYFVDVRPAGSTNLQRIAAKHT